MQVARRDPVEAGDLAFPLRRVERSEGYTVLGLEPRRLVIEQTDSKANQRLLRRRGGRPASASELVRNFEGASIRKLP